MSDSLEVKVPREAAIRQATSMRGWQGTRCTNGG